MIARGGNALVALFAAVGLAACGGGSGTSDTASSPGGGAEPTARQMFTDVCGSCHTLADAQTRGHVGPDLDNLHPSAATVLRQVTRGGSGMPSFKDSLSPAQIRMLADYVSGATRAP